MPEWVCADCGDTYEERTTPCTSCASERIARLPDSKTTARVGRTADPTWKCTECETTHIKNNPPCNECGGMTFEVVDNSPAQEADGHGHTGGSSSDPYTDSARSITMRTLVAWGFGILAILNLTGALIFLAPVAFLLHAIAVYVSFPPARRQLKRRFGVTFSTAAAALTYAVSTVAGNIFFLV